jgi:hypothetical protein
MELKVLFLRQYLLLSLAKKLIGHSAFCGGQRCRQGASIFAASVALVLASGFGVLAGSLLSANRCFITLLE